MKILVRLTACLLVGTCAACGSQAGPTGEATQEVVTEATAEIVAEATPANPSWVTVTRPDPLFPGWELQYPEGWELVNLDDRNLFLFNAPGINQRMFVGGLQPGEVALQFSLNHVTDADETPESHLAVLTGTMRDFVFGTPEPYSAADLSGIRQVGTNERLGLTVVASSRMFLIGQFVDVFAYSRTDELAANLSLMNAVIETARYTLATE